MKSVRIKSCNCNNCKFLASSWILICYVYYMIFMNSICRVHGKHICVLFVILQIRLRAPINLLKVLFKKYPIDICSFGDLQFDGLNVFILYQILLLFRPFNARQAFPNITFFEHVFDVSITSEQNINRTNSGIFEV